MDGIVVDFDNHGQAYQLSPRIKALAAAKNPVEAGDSTAVYATVFDGDSQDISYEWSTTLGTISGSGPTVQLLTPAEGNAEVRVIASDPEGNKDTATLIISVVAEINVAPQIVEIQKSAPFAAPAGTVQLTCLASDGNNDPLTYLWTADGGTFNGNGSTVEWTAPATEGIFHITVKVTDDEGLFAQASTGMLVKNFVAVSENIIAHYPFTGNANDVSGHNLHGTANGAVLTADQDGIPQSAYFFNGGSQHILVPNNTQLNFQDGITVSCWFKASALPEKETFILSHGSWQNRWKMSITPERYLRWTVNSLNGVSDLDADVLLQPDQFYHAVATYDGAVLALYLDGQLRTYKALTGKIRTTSVAFLMGQMLPGQPEYNFKGVIDDVKIFDDALPPDAVATLYGLGVTGVHDAQNYAIGTLELSPNPVTERLTIRLVRDGVTGLDGATVQIRDLAGRLVIEKTGFAGTSLDIDVKNCKPGVYTVHIMSENTRATARFVKI
jgi:hypothetical protein